MQNSGGYIWRHKGGILTRNKVERFEWHIVCQRGEKEKLRPRRKAMTNLDSILKTETLLCWE